jgi:hypothetical protein
MYVKAVLKFVQIQKWPRRSGSSPGPGQPTEEAAVNNSTAPHPHPSTEEQPHACYEGLVFIGHLVEDESGEEVEVFEAVLCRKCRPEVEAR